MKNTKGITLIALVITIIVLLILAGISISMLSGDNSILNKAAEAKETTAEKSLKEETQIVISGRIAEKKTTGTNVKTLEEELKEKIKNAEITGISGNTEACYVKRGDVELTVYDSGEIEEGKYEIWDGSTVECPELKNENGIWNWYIFKPSQLKFLADFVNNGNSLTGEVDLTSKVTEYNAEDVTMTVDTTIYLMNNLDLGARQTNGTKTAGSDWIPIGKDASNVNNKLGTFEGNNYIIKGVYINTTDSFVGIFGNSNTIQNLTVKDSYITGDYMVGGVVGRIRKGKLENCHNKNTSVTALSEEMSSVGGIAGEASTSNTISKCTNSGTITGKGITYGGYVGGIVGYGLQSVIITGCTNNGTIKGEASQVGGIIGIAKNNSKISECVNNATVSGKKSVSGIIGETTCVIEKCINNGNIKGKDMQVAGIAACLGESAYKR